MLMHSTPNEHSLYSGCSYVIKKPTHLFKEKYSGFRLCGDKYWGEKGFVVGKMKALPVAIYLGTAFDANAPILVPKNVKHYAAIGCYLKSGEYLEGVRFLDQKLDVAVAVLNKVPFDLEHWSAIADEQYPNGLPQPYSNDPTQWIFHGHPAGSVIWCENEKRIIEGDLRTDDTVLQVAVARLLGYQWPAELDTDMELAPEQRAWVERCKALAKHADDDGIVCLAAVRGETPAHQRVEALLETAYGQRWTTHTRDQLLKTVGSPSIEQWMYNQFF